MKTLTIARMKNLYKEYEENDKKHRELTDKIEELKKQCREIESETGKIGDKLSMLGKVSKKLDDWGLLYKRKAAVEQLKPRENEENREKCKKIFEELKRDNETMILTPCAPRQWVGHVFANSWGRGYVFKINNHPYDNNGLARYDTSYKTYCVSVNERPDLKRYKWELTMTFPENPNSAKMSKTIIKCRTLEEVSENIVGAMETVENEFAKTEIMQYAPDIFELDKINVDDGAKIPFDIEGKTFVEEG